MKKTIIVLVLMSLSFALRADDSDNNRVAAQIKYQVEWAIKHYYDGSYGFCDVMITMRHKGRHAIVKKVSHTGSREYCSFIKKQIRKGSKYRYDVEEKLIQLSF
ncbi:hypothetical protein [Vibrio nigripulchritudo]|uniref:hypothetical protein n=1 Tax=Vibrio nigripulchritudo TaxID=28173 RepID=UPI002493B769|nr:hypothetical protein [Vibrio nigripulchritudo]BDU37182.1 hypothetical protein TUMSATVNIG2_16510 [Vibrio nigripulchritudo]